MRTRIPRCVVCGKPVPPAMRDRGLPIHAQECAVFLVERLVAAEPRVLDLLPDEYRADRRDDALLPEDCRVARNRRWQAEMLAATERAARGEPLF